ncbi:hypothetical protein QE430_002540 [Microbacterium testaceum]|uniref:hypothetical protein n=1 Tax=Microbacterium testaceum TaxID=2033 RepID=UPI00277DCD79|nr:hypothetical protein [Microbacterium testaceum]MDQ1174233.1 hypothetical protein [Microbacterium testaceum]
MTTSPTPEPPAPVSATPIARRTVLAGAAWSVPAIALTTGSPAFAASGTTLSFSKSSYSGPGCSTINGVKVRATDNGTAKAGVSVTTSLSGGFVFFNGGTTSTGITGSDGSITLPGISVPATGGVGTASATASGAAGSSTTLKGTDATVAKYIQNGAAQTASNIPTGSVPAFAGCYLAPDGRVLDAANGTTVLSASVAAFGQLYRDNDNWVIPLLKTDGSAGSLVSGRASYPSWQERTYPSVPAGSTPIVAEYFLTSDGSIVYGGNGVAQATNVASWGQMSTWGNQPQNNHNDARLPIKKTDGSFRIFKLQAEYPTTGVPSGSTPAADAYFLTNDGRLIAGDDGSVLTTHVDRFGQMLWDGAHWRWPLRKTDGSFTVIKDGTESAVSGIPSGSTPVSGGMFLTPDGRLIDSANSNTFTATNVSTTGQILYTDWAGSWVMTLGIAETSPVYLHNGSAEATTGVPTDTTPVAGGLFLTPDYRMIDGTSGNVVSTNVDSWGTIFIDGTQGWYLPVKKRDGSFTYLASSSEQSTVGVPAGSVPVTRALFLSSDGRLIDGSNNGAVVATGIKEFGDVFVVDASSTWYIPVTKFDGTCVVLKNGAETAASGVPSGSKPVGGGLFLTSDGRLIDGYLTGLVIATDVTTCGVITVIDGQGNWKMPFRKTDGICVYAQSSAVQPTPGVPSGSTPVAASLFLDANGRLIQADDNGKLLASQVASYGQMFVSHTSDAWYIPLALHKSSC